jgi:hypothetical protein
MMSRLRTSVCQLGEVRFFHHILGPPEQWMRFVPVCHADMSGGAEFLGRKEQQLSLTRIRRVFAEMDKEKFMQALTGVTLNQSMLSGYLQWRKREERLRQMLHGKKVCEQRERVADIRNKDVRRCEVGKRKKA